MKIRPALLALPLLLSVPAMAQDAVVPVMLAVNDSDSYDRNLMQAIRETLSRTPSFNMMAKPTPDTLVITVPGGFGREGHEDTIKYSYTVVFSRNGDKLGESLESCVAGKVQECADQLAADAQSAAVIRK
jgi:hypothetical protein